MLIAAVATLTAKSFADLLSGPMLDVYVGAERKHWSLHQNLLNYHSAFFDDKSKLKNNDGGSVRDTQIELLEEDPDAFEVLVKWLYQGTIDDVSTLPKEQKWEYAFTCQKLYLLCDKLDLHDLKNCAIDQFRKGCHETGLVPGAEEIQPVYERTLPSSPLRKLMSRIVARQIMDPDVVRDASQYQACFDINPSFAIDVINVIRTDSGGILFDDPTEGNSCRYHEHDNGRTCHKTVKFVQDTDVRELEIQANGRSP